MHDLLELEPLAAPTQSPPKSLAATLMRLEFGIIPTHRVKAFQRHFRWQQIRNEFADGDLGSSIAICGALGLGIFYGGMELASRFLVPPALSFEAVLNLVVAWVFYLGALGGLMMVGLGLFLVLAIPMTARWQQLSLYPKRPFYSLTNEERGVWMAIPSWVHRKADLLYAELRDVEITCEYMPKDPFLVASYEGQRYYIAHWGEPQFEDGE